VQAFNSLGTTLAPLFGGFLISAAAPPVPRGTAILTAQQRAADVRVVELPYLLIAVVLIALAVLVWRVRLRTSERNTPSRTRGAFEAQPLASPQPGAWRAGDLPVSGRGDWCRLDRRELHLAAQHRRNESLRSLRSICRSCGAAMMGGRFIGACSCAGFPLTVSSPASASVRSCWPASVTTSGHLAMWSLITVGCVNP